MKGFFYFGAVIHISVIVPTYNEANSIAPYLQQIVQARPFEVIVVDSPASTDQMKEVCALFGVHYVRASVAGRNHQMNQGAQQAKGNVFYFVHADCLVQTSYIEDIQHAIESACHMGCYRFKFNSYPYLFMYINSFFTRFPMIWCRGGDQTLFIKKEVFEDLGAFCPDHCIMEEYDLIQKAQGKYRFKLIPKSVIVSSRKYKNNGYFQVLRANYIAMRDWKRGLSPSLILKAYKERLNPS